MCRPTSLRITRWLARRRASPGPYGDVPQDSLEERLWREGPEPQLVVEDDVVVDVIEPDPAMGIDGADELLYTEATDDEDDGQLTGTALVHEPDDLPAAEESALHVVEGGPDQFDASD